MSKSFKSIFMFFVLVVMAAPGHSRTSKNDVMALTAEILNDFKTRALAVENANSDEQHKAFCALANDYLHHDSIAHTIFPQHWNSSNEFQRNRIRTIITQLVARDFSTKVLSVLSYNFDIKKVSSRKLKIDGDRIQSYKVVISAFNSEKETSFNMFMVETRKDPLDLKVRNIGVSLGTILSDYKNEAIASEDKDTLIDQWDANSLPCVE